MQVNKTLINVFELGIPIIIFGDSDFENFECLKLSLAFRKNLRLTYYTKKSSEINQLDSIEMIKTLGNDQYSQKQFIMSSLRSDPDGFVFSYLDDESHEMFFNAFITGCSLGTTVIINNENIKQIITSWINLGIKNNTLENVLSQLIFIHGSLDETKIFKAELKQSEVIVTQYNHDIKEIPLIPNQEPTSTKEEDLLYLSDRLHPELLKLLEAHRRTSWVPVTEKLVEKNQIQAKEYFLTLHPEKLVAQFDAEDLPSELKSFLGANNVLQITSFENDYDFEYAFKVINKDIFRKSYPSLLPITIFNEVFYLKEMVPIDDFPFFDEEDYKNLNIKLSDQVFDHLEQHDSDNIPIAISNNKFLGWPCWLQGPEYLKDANQLFFQINTHKNEFNQFMGGEMIYIFFNPLKKDSWVAIDQFS